MNYKGLFNQIVERVLSYESKGFVYFLTLTVRDEVTEGSITKDTLSNFFKKLEYRGYEIEGYIWIKELQKRGVIHYHVLVLTTKKISVKVIEKCWKKGFVFVQRVRGVNKSFRRVFNYLFKYISKELKKNSENFKMKRRMGRGGILRFRVEPFLGRVARFSEFEYVGSAFNKGERVKVYRHGNLVMFMISNRGKIKIEISEVDIEKVVDKFKYRKRWSGLARIMNDLKYMMLNKAERVDIIGYHDFDRKVNGVVWGLGV